MLFRSPRDRTEVRPFREGAFASWHAGFTRDPSRSTRDSRAADGIITHLCTTGVVRGLVTPGCLCRQRLFPSVSSSPAPFRKNCGHQIRIASPLPHQGSSTPNPSLAHSLHFFLGCQHMHLPSASSSRSSSLLNSLRTLDRQPVAPAICCWLIPDVCRPAKRASSIINCWWEPLSCRQ